MPKKKQIDLAALKRMGVVVDEIERLTEERRKLYDEHDELAVRLEKVPAKTLMEHELVLENAFAEKNTQWGHGPVRRLKFSRPKKPKEKAAA